MPWLFWTYHKWSPPTRRANALVPLELLGPHVRVLPHPHGDALVRTEGTGRTLLVHGGDVRIEVDDKVIGFFGVTPTHRPAISGACGAIPALMDLIAKLEELGLVINATTP